MCTDDFQKWTIFPRYLLHIKGSMYEHFLQKKKTPSMSQSDFYKDILGTWESMYMVKPTSEEQMQNESIWNNMFIKSGGHPICWEKWREAGIIKIKDLITDAGTFVTVEDIRRTYDVHCNFLHILQIRTAIPWLSSMTLQNNEDNPTSLYIGEGERSVDVTCQSSKNIYKTIRHRKNRTPTAIAQWEKKYTDLLDTPSLWKNIFVSPFLATRETKLQSLQYKIFNNIVPTRKYLFNRKGISTPAFVFCGEEDNIHHFFLFCDDVQTFLESVSTLVSQVLELPLHNVSEKEFMLGLTSKSKTDQKLNTIIMHVKFYIYRQRLFHDNKMDSLEWFYEFKMYLLKERQICKSELKPKRFRIWEAALQNM